MDGFRLIQVSFSLILLLQITVAGPALRVVVRVGDRATLPCANVTGNQNQCGGISWLYADLLNKPAVELVRFGRIGKDAETKSDRLSVAENCALVITNVTSEDVGQYTCRRLKSRQSRDSDVYLAAVTSGDSTTEPTRATENSRKAGTIMTTTAIDDFPSELQAHTDCSVSNYIMLVLRVAELALITVITVLLIRARGNRRSPEDKTVSYNDDYNDMRCSEI